MFGMSVQRSWRDKGVGNALLLALLEWALGFCQLERSRSESFRSLAGERFEFSRCRIDSNR